LSTATDAPDASVDGAETSISAATEVVEDQQAADEAAASEPSTDSEADEAPEQDGENE
jgi:hypothetical protein